MIQFSDIKHFIEGNYNKLLDSFNQLDEDTKTLALKRMEICKGCPHLVVTPKKSKCGECGCKFPGLTYAKEKKCPIGKW